MSAAVPLVIAVAPNGARKTRLEHPALPISADELAEAAWNALAAGAAMIHLHVRGDDGGHSLDVARYREAIAAIRTRVGPEMIIQVTTEAVGIYSAEQQMAMVRELRPEAVSLAICELCPPGGDEEQAATFFDWLRREQISPQYILYSVEDVRRFETLREGGAIPGERPNVLYVLGRYGDGGSSSPAAQLLQPMLAAMAGDVSWSICAFGSMETAAMLRAAELGGHCRVGFENNMQLASGDTAPDNAALVTQLADGAATMGRVIATPAQARELFGMV